jgi:hypothetical protein
MYDYAPNDDAGTETYIHNTYIPRYISYIHGQGPTCNLYLVAKINILSLVDSRRPAC